MLQKLKFQLESVLPPDFSARLHAWWEGVEYTPAEVSDQDLIADDEEAASSFDEELGDAFVRVSQGLWGEGNLAPSDAGFHGELIQRLCLDEEVGIAVLGIGLGGGVRSIASETEVWIEGYESDPDYLEAAEEQNTMAGLAKKITLNSFSSSDPEFPEGKFQSFVSFEYLYAVPETDRKGVLASAIKSLRQGGNLLISDFVLGADDVSVSEKFFPPSADPSSLWTKQTYIEEIQGLGVGIRSQDDLTEQYLDEVTKGWANWQKVAASLKAMYTDERDVAEINHALKTLAELWAARVEALKSGDIRLVGLFAKSET